MIFSALPYDTHAIAPLSDVSTDRRTDGQTDVRHCATIARTQTDLCPCLSIIHGSSYDLLFLSLPTGRAAWKECKIPSILSFSFLCFSLLVLFTRVVLGKKKKKNKFLRWTPMPRRKEREGRRKKDVDRISTTHVPLQG